MNSNSLNQTCLNAFAFKTVNGAVIGFTASILLALKSKRLITMLGAGIGGGLAGYECEDLFKRLKLGTPVPNQMTK
jgi:hypothetical protein